MSLHAIAATERQRTGYTRTLITVKGKEESPALGHNTTGPQAWGARGMLSRPAARPDNGTFAATASAET